MKQSSVHKTICSCQRWMWNISKLQRESQAVAAKIKLSLQTVIRLSFMHHRYLFTQFLLIGVHIFLFAGPPMMPQPLVEGDERMVMVPAIFTCKQTLAELQHTPIPSSSALIITYLKSG